MEENLKSLSDKYVAAEARERKYSLLERQATAWLFTSLYYQSQGEFERAAAAARVGGFIMEVVNANAK